jgi:hypothetical protein
LNGPSSPSQRAEAPVATITASDVYVRIVPDSAEPDGSSVVSTVNGRFERSTRTTDSHFVSAPNRWACLRIRSISSGPWTPSGKPGKLSTAVVQVSCPPGSGPSNTTGARFALAA